MNLTGEQRKKCKAIIHTASVAAGSVGAGLAQIPLADNALITPIQITMITSIGAVFGIHVVEGMAKGIIASSAASIVGRGAVQTLVGWIPGIGNAINTATAAGITEAIGWAAVKHFSELQKKQIESDIESVNGAWEERLIEYTGTIEEEYEEEQKNQIESDTESANGAWEECPIAYTDTVEEEYLVQRDFFGDGIDIDVSRVFPVLVMATMSSGKSTLINSLIGEDILPNKNAACTAKVYSILDDDASTAPKLYLTNSNGKVRVVENNLDEELKLANEEDDVKNILLTAQIKGVQNTEKSLLIIDTPGPNNSQDNNHEVITREILSKVNGGLIIYVINATQMGINDDANLMGLLRDYLSTHEKMEVLFVINKMDEIDDEKESIDGLLENSKEYIEKQGIEKPKIIATSALAAQIFQKVLNGKELTRKERTIFLDLYKREIFRPQSQNKKLGEYVWEEDVSNSKEKVCVKEDSYTKSELMSAIKNTGIIALEEYIQKMQIQSGGNEELKVNVRGQESGTYKEENFEGLLEELAKNTGIRRSICERYLQKNNFDFNATYEEIYDKIMKGQIEVVYKAEDHKK